MSDQSSSDQPLSEHSVPQAPASGAARGSPGALTPQEALLQLGRLPLGHMALGEVLQRVADLAQASIIGADEVSVTLIERGKPRSVAFTGDLAPQLDERQYERGFGPCLDAAVTGSTILIVDTDAERTYTAFAALARKAGVGSTASVGMPSPQETVGGLNLYSRTVDVWSSQSLADTRRFADYAAVALLNASILDSRAALARQLESAMATRAVIEQAKGVLMARHGLDADAAFAELSRRSQNANRKLHAVAADVVAEVSAPGGQT